MSMFALLGGQGLDYRTKKDQKEIKGTTNPLMANLDITHFISQREKAWNHWYVTGRKWWTRLVQTKSTLRTNNGEMSRITMSTISGP